VSIEQTLAAASFLYSCWIEQERLLETLDKQQIEQNTLLFAVVLVVLDPIRHLHEMMHRKAEQHSLEQFLDIEKTWVVRYWLYYPCGE